MWVLLKCLIEKNSTRNNVIRIKNVFFFFYCRIQIQNLYCCFIIITLTLSWSIDGFSCKWKIRNVCDGNKKKKKKKSWPIRRSMIVDKTISRPIRTTFYGPQNGFRSVYIRKISQTSKFYPRNSKISNSRKVSDWDSYVVEIKPWLEYRNTDNICNQKCSRKSVRDHGKRSIFVYYKPKETIFHQECKYKYKVFLYCFLMVLVLIGTLSHCCHIRRVIYF